LRLGRRIKRRGGRRQQADAEGARDRNCAKSFHRDPIMISCRLLARVFCTMQLFRTTLLRQAILSLRIRASKRRARGDEGDELAAAPLRDQVPRVRRRVVVPSYWTAVVRLRARC
jgi:hypothetical protein